MTAARDARIAGIAGAVLVLWDLSGWDLGVVRWFASANGFAWRDAWLTSTLLHEGGRWLAWGVVGFLALDAWRGLIDGPSASQRRRWLLASVLCVVLVPALKRLSHTSCPWDLAEFGGTAAYVPHWWIGLRDGGPGHCFPSGHAVAAFGLLPGYFMLREQRPVLARVWLAIVCAAGLAFGGAQLVRGAHYPSHTLWSGWLCWVVCAGVGCWGSPPNLRTHAGWGDNPIRRDITARTAPGNAPGSRARRRSPPATSPP